MDSFSLFPGASIWKLDTADACLLVGKPGSERDPRIIDPKKRENRPILFAGHERGGIGKIPGISDGQAASRSVKLQKRH
ncbi:MAG: hypothetical protein WCQ57_05200 [Verrucomicrobiota bacterium]